MDEQEQKTNVHRIRSALQDGGHDHSVPAPPWATAAFERLCRENPVTRDFTLEQAIELLRTKLKVKDAKIARKKQALGPGWTFDWIGLVVFTLNPSIASGAFYQHVASAPFGPLQHIDRAFLVAEPFPVTLEPGGICEGVMEIPLLPRT